MKIVFVLKRHWLALTSLALVIVLLVLAEPAHLVFTAAAVVIVGLWVGETSVELAQAKRRLHRASLHLAEERAAVIAQQDKGLAMVDAVSNAYIDTLGGNMSEETYTRLADLYTQCKTIQFGPRSEPSPSVTQGADGGLIGAHQ
jgi:hypothetical protein